MSEFKKGDRVKVIYEAIYDGESFFEGEHMVANPGEGRNNFLRVPATATIEKLPAPLPTTPGSVIRFKDIHDSKYALKGNGEWVSLRYGSIHSTAEFDERFYEVIFDAGTVA